MATVAMSAKRTAGEKNGPGAGHSGVERKRAAETDLEQVTALREVRKVAKLRGNDKSSNPDLKLPPSAFASVAREHRCSAADIAGLRCARKDLYDVIRGKTAGVRDGPCHPPDDRGHIIFEPERNLTPRFKMLTCVGTGTFGKVRDRDVVGTWSGRGRDVVGTWSGRDRDVVGTWSGRGRDILVTLRERFSAHAS